MADWIDFGGKAHAVFWLSDLKHEVVIGYETKASHNGSDGSICKDFGGSSTNQPIC
jgi:hypothetical protein